jgi:hypothetical protein
MGLKDWLYAESMLLMHRHTMAAPERGRHINIRVIESHSVYKN